MLFASTYQAGDHVVYATDPSADPAVVERKRTGKRATLLGHPGLHCQGHLLATEAAGIHAPRAVKGYKAQSELVMAHLTGLLDSLAARGESAVVEGVHLNLSTVLPLMARHAALVPFLITIRHAWLEVRPTVAVGCGSTL